uniref:Secreted protein n=1 Tax=Arundo donax TaxID=35708 RepID=A0A0A9DUK0_ARUDO
MMLLLCLCLRRLLPLLFISCPPSKKTQTISFNTSLQQHYRIYSEEHARTKFNILRD